MELSSNNAVGEKHKQKKWTTSFMLKLRSSSSNHHQQQQQDKHGDGRSGDTGSGRNVSIPKEFLCPISNSLMTQPVIVASGHTFDLSSLPLSPHVHLSNSTTLIPNLALRSAILKFAAANNLSLPTTTGAATTTTDTLRSGHVDEEDRIVSRLRSGESEVIRETLESLRETTRSTEGSRILLCTPRILTALKSALASRRIGVQVNAVATVVNLSLEKENKVKILRSGIVPILINVVRGGFSEAKEHACSALFSLALDDANKTAIGVLGALQPLVHALRSPARNDAAWALYHLTLVQSNRVKLVKLGAVQSLLSLVEDSSLGYPVLLIFCNMASCVEGRAAMLDAGAVGVIVSMLAGNGNGNGNGNGMECPIAVSALDSCMTVLYELSQGGLRFKILAKEAGTLEVLKKLQEFSVSGRVKAMARKIMEAVMDKWEEIEEDVDWEELIDLGLANGNGSGNSGNSPSSGHF